MFVLLILIFIVFIGIKYFLPWWEKRKIIKKIPGPTGHLILGYILPFLRPPEEIWKTMRKLAVIYGPIYQYWHINKPIVNLLCPEDIEIVLSTTKHSTKSELYNMLHPWLGTGLLTSNGSKWQSRRKILTPAFHFSILQDFIAIFTEESNLLIKELEEECFKPYTNIAPIITRFTLRTICESAMGIKLDRKQKISQDYSNATLRMGEILLLRITRPWYLFDTTYFFTPLCHEQKKLLNQLHCFTKSVIKQRRDNFAESPVVEKMKNDIVGKKRRLAMLDLLISAKNSGESIDDEGIREEVDTFMFEGHETTATCISFTLLLLACHRDIQNTVFEEIQEILGDSKEALTIHKLQNLAYLDRVLKESLRLYPSVHFILRVSDEEINTPSGYKIPTNTSLQLHIYDLHHNPEVYPDPYRFDPDRFLPENAQKRHPFAYIPFSAGPRNCIGQKFALLEVKIAIITILKRFVLEPMDTPSSVVLKSHLVLKSKSGVKIKFRTRNT